MIVIDAEFFAGGQLSAGDIGCIRQMVVPPKDDCLGPKPATDAHGTARKKRGMWIKRVLFDLQITGVAVEMPVLQWRPCFSVSIRGL